MAVASVVGLLGDSGLQVYEQCTDVDSAKPLTFSDISIELTRAKNIIVYRALQAPLVDLIWLGFDRRFIGLPPVLGIIAKVLSDQILLMPPSVVAFFLTQGLLEGNSLDDSLIRVEKNTIPTILAALPFWLSVHTVTFGVLPPYARIAWASSAAVFWNAYMSSVNQTAIRDLNGGSVFSADGVLG
jgi:protein Mpv17